MVTLPVKVSDYFCKIILVKWQLTHPPVEAALVVGRLVVGFGELGAQDQVLVGEPPRGVRLG